MVKPSPFTVFGISRNASEREIKSAYHRLCKLYHPDKNPQISQYERIKNKCMLELIYESYLLLLDEKNKGIYLKQGWRGVYHNKEEDTPFNDFSLEEMIKNENPQVFYENFREENKSEDFNCHNQNQVESDESSGSIYVYDTEDFLSESSSEPKRKKKKMNKKKKYNKKKRKDRIFELEQEIQMLKSKLCEEKEKIENLKTKYEKEKNLYEKNQKIFNEKIKQNEAQEKKIKLLLKNSKDEFNAMKGLFSNEKEQNMEEIKKIKENERKNFYKNEEILKKMSEEIEKMKEKSIEQDKEINFLKEKNEILKIEHKIETEKLKEDICNLKKNIVENEIDINSVNVGDGDNEIVEENTNESNLNYGRIYFHTCEICSANLSSLSNLLRHKKLHTLNRSICKICNASFSRSDALKRHFDSMHN